MSEPLLRPADRKKIAEGVAACARCADRLEQLKAIGVEKPELEARVKQQQALFSGALELDAAARENAGNG